MEGHRLSASLKIVLSLTTPFLIASQKPISLVCAMGRTSFCPCWLIGFAAAEYFHKFAHAVFHCIFSYCAARYSGARDGLHKFRSFGLQNLKVVMILSFKFILESIRHDFI